METDERRRRETEDLHVFLTDFEGLQRNIAAKQSQGGERFTAASNLRSVLTTVAAFGSSIDAVRRQTLFLQAVAKEL